ncbi:MAG: efflux RND transporter periplasmic adaptor subunit [Candidatus Aminicenantales bacterium]
MRKSQRMVIVSLGIFLVGLAAVLVTCRPGEKPQEKILTAAAEKSVERQILYYTCGMHPSVRVSPEDYEKGNRSCPICNMDLVPVYKEEAMDMEPGGHALSEEGEILVRLDARARALARVKTEEVRSLPLFKEISTVGQIDYDERKVAYVAAWISGRIDRLFVDFTGVHVKKGDPLVWIYSPDLLTTQEEYLLALETLERVKEKGDPETIQGAQSLVEAAEKRLLLWGISPAQVEEIREKRQTSTHMTIYAPIGGTVIHKNALEGKYVKEGENLYRIADLSHLWVLADIYESELSWIKQGQEVEIRTAAFPGERFTGRISFIDPYLNPKTRSVKVRVDVPNPWLKLKPGMYVDVFIRSKILEGTPSKARTVYTCTMHPEVEAAEPGPCPECGMPLVKKVKPASSGLLAVPKEAVLDTGTRTLVYIEKEEGVYAPREVELGPEAMAEINGTKRRFYVLKSGLEEGMKVVAHANFLVDSQSQITGAAEAVYGGALEAEEKKPPTQHIH